MLWQVLIILVSLLFYSEAQAAGAGAMAHMSASVTSVLTVSEVLPINFGSFAVTCANGLCDTLSTLVLSDQGARTATSTGADTVMLLNGAGGGSPQETGGQQPGFYKIDAGGEGDGTQHVYVSFADMQGNIIDINHPNNHVILSGPTANAFTVDSFTFESDTGTTGYVQQNPSTTDIYGTYIPLVNGIATIRIGATLHTSVGPSPIPGQYTGTYNVMVSY